MAEFPRRRAGAYVGSNVRGAYPPTEERMGMALEELAREEGKPGRIGGALDAAREAMIDGAGFGVIATDFYWVLGCTMVTVAPAVFLFNWRMLGWGGHDEGDRPGYVRLTGRPRT